MAAFRLQGKTWREDISIPDLDIYIDKSGKRFIPLLRLLRELKASGSIENGVITFSIRKGAKASIDLNSSELILDSGKSSIEIISGISDMTEKPEVFIQDDLIRSAFDINFAWSDIDYTYRMTTELPLRVFEEFNDRHKMERPVIHQLSSTLSETEPIQHPEDYRQLVSIIDAGLRFDSRTIQNDERLTSSSIKPDVTLYGQIAKGNYYLHLTEQISHPGSGTPKLPLWFEEGLWTYDTDSRSIRAGDTVIGWSNLVVPSTKLTGIVARGLYGDGTSSNDNSGFLSGNHFSFMASRSFDGYAPLGSTVEIYVNNLMADSAVVDETPGAPPGQGRYQFSVTGLLNRALNEIRIVITQPDGTKDEHIEYIAGSNALLPAGQTAYALGTGTSRQRSGQEMQTNGIMAGAGYYYGLNRDATFGLSLVTQDNFFKDPSQFSSDRLPRRTYLGQTLAYRALNKLMVREEVAINYEHERGNTSQANNLTLDYITQPLLLSAYLFNYGEQYSNGSTAVSNRQGYALFGVPALPHEINLAATVAEIGEKSSDRQEQYLAAQTKFPAIMARSNAMLRFDHIVEKNAPFPLDGTISNTMYSFNFKTGPWLNTTLETEYVWGDRIDSISSSDLRYGISIPMVGSIPSYGTRVKAETIFSNNSRVNLSYRDYGYNTKSIELGMARTPRSVDRFDMALRLRHDLTRRTNSVDLNIEYPFDNKRRYLVGMSANYNELSSTTSYNLYFSARDLFFVGHDGLNRIGGTRYIQPQMGGLNGFVYLDVNANGHYDKGEPGIGGVEVLVDGYQKYTSSESGHFFVGRNIHQDEVTVELNEIELPAIYTPTQGRQRAAWSDHIFTRANLGIAVLGAISGEVSIWQDGRRLRPLPGAIVKARFMADNTIVTQSITDNNGIYYLGELKPGTYELSLDPDSVPPSLKVKGEFPKVTLPVSLKPVEIESTNIQLHSTIQGHARVELPNISSTATP